MKLSNQDGMAQTQDEASNAVAGRERSAPPTRLLQILKALEVETASDVQDILRRSRATFR